MKLIRELKIPQKKNSKKQLPNNAVGMNAEEATKYMHEQVYMDNIEAVRSAIENGADVNHRGEGGQTPVMQAVLRGQYEMVQMLLGLNPKPDLTIGEENGYTPMHGAAFQGRPSIIRLLLAEGLNPSDRHKDGYTPLHRTCWGKDPRHTEAARVLIEEAHVSPNELGQDGKAPLSMTKNKLTEELLKRHGAVMTQREL